MDRRLDRRTAFIAVRSAALCCLLVLGLAPGALGATGTAAASQRSTGQAVTSTCAPLKFGGVSYCPGDIRGIRRTAYGVNARIALGGLNVVGVSTGTVTVLGWSQCPPGMFCGATLDTMVLTWQGTARPRTGDVINLFGITATSSLRPVGYVKTGYCDPDFGC